MKYEIIRTDWSLVDYETMEVSHACLLETIDCPKWASDDQLINYFDIDEQNGRLSVTRAGSLDYEGSRNIYRVHVKVTDNHVSPLGYNAVVIIHIIQYAWTLSNTFPACECQYTNLAEPHPEGRDNGGCDTLLRHCSC